MSQEALKALATSGLNGEGFRVLMALLARLDFENLLIINQAEIAREINIKRPNVNRAIKNLIAIDALLEGPKVGTNRSYRLNPYFGWKGSAKNHHKALDKRMKAAGLKVFEGNKDPKS